MAQLHQRAVAFILAVLFLLASVGSAAAVYLTIHQEQEDQKTAQAALEAARNENNKTTQEGKLEGTKLANFTPLEKIDQLRIEDVAVGTGGEVQPGATITAHYTGALAKDGTIFQSSLDSGQPFTAKLVTVEESVDGQGLIAGWVEGIPGMREGGKRRLIIPASMAYGGQERPGIPANSDLVFDIELVSIGE